MHRYKFPVMTVIIMYTWTVPINLVNLETQKQDVLFFTECVSVVLCCSSTGKTASSGDVLASASLCSIVSSAPRSRRLCHPGTQNTQEGGDRLNILSAQAAPTRISVMHREVLQPMEGHELHPSKVLATVGEIQVRILRGTGGPGSGSVHSTDDLCS